VVITSQGAGRSSGRRGGRAVPRILFGALIGQESSVSGRETAEVSSDFGCHMPQTVSTAPWLPDVTIAV
jgi:hypothetical protein